MICDRLLSDRFKLKQIRKQLLTTQIQSSGGHPTPTCSHLGRSAIGLHFAAVCSIPQSCDCDFHWPAWLKTLIPGSMTVVNWGATVYSYFKTSWHICGKCWLVHFLEEIGKGLGHFSRWEKMDLSIAQQKLTVKAASDQEDKQNGGLTPIAESNS